jgi:deoxyribodipyrimidine photo-lyase
MRCVVMWFRRDLRLTDHQALAAAVSAGAHVVPLFVVDPAFTAAGAPRRAYLGAALAALDRSMHGALIYRHGDPALVVPGFAAEVGADSVFVTRDYGPYGRRRDAAVAQRLTADGRRLVGVGTPYARPPGSVVKDDGSAYAVFTPYLRRWRSQPLASGVGSGVDGSGTPWLGADAFPCDGPPVAVDPGCVLPEAGEAAAHARWSTFRGGALDRYDTLRDLPADDATSRLSADLRWGVVHPHQLLADLEPCTAHDTFAAELAWRDFYADVLLRRPQSAWANLNQRFDPIAVDTDAAARQRFRRWASGHTGYPLVDAGMRQLSASGWMHNRVRMIVASFLVKDLHLPWQWGAKHFMNHLIDGDLASNNHGWQWAAGTGTDAAPYFRVFNPTAQAARFDPDGHYAARWIPELGTDAYPSPMVDHAAERIEALRRYGSVAAGTR